MRLSKAARIIPFLCVAGCAGRTPEPVVQTVQVSVPTPVSCVPKDMPSAPAKPPTAAMLKRAQDAAERYQMLAESWTLNAPRLALDEAVIASCQSAGAPPK